MSFEKEAANIPDCVKVDFDFPPIDADRILSLLENPPNNSDKKAPTRKKWVLWARDQVIPYNAKAWEALEPLIKSFPNDGIGMAQISLMPPETHLNIHFDGFNAKGEIAPQYELFNNTLRMHIPMVTTDQSMIYCAGKFYNLRKNELWMLNNMRKHSALNLHKKEGRFHLIFDVVPTRETLSLIQGGNASLGKYRPRFMEKLRDGKTMGGTNRPDFFVLETLEGASAPLTEHLHQHEDLLVPETPSLRYYDIKRYQDWTLEKYLKNFNAKKRNQNAYECSSYYLRHPHAARWIRQDLPDAKFLVWLTDPVERSYAHYLFMAQAGKEKRTFEDCIKSEAKFIKEDWNKTCNDESHMGKKAKQFSYLARGRYAEQLEHWYKSFPANRLHILFSEEFAQSPRLAMRDVFDFLGMPPCREMDVRLKRSELTSSSMDPKTRQWLEDYFAPHNAELEKLLERKVGW